MMQLWRYSIQHLLKKPDGLIKRTRAILVSLEGVNIMTITVQVTCDTGKSWITDINTDLAGARQYFMGNVFTDESDNGTETRNTVTQVKELPEWF